MKNFKAKFYQILELIRYNLENFHIYFVFHPLKIFEYKELLKNVKISRTDKILDLGCGNGLETMLLGKKCDKIYGIDIFKKDLDIAKRRSHFLKKKINSEFRLVRLENAGFQTKTFDKVFSICVLEHISNYVEVLEETYRILRLGGQIIFTVDSMDNIENNKFLEYHKKRFDVKTYFKKNDLNSILKKIGFKKIEIYPIFKSDYAKNLLMKFSKKLRITTILFSLLSYLKLIVNENRNNTNKKGLFFIIKCYK